MDPQYRRWQWQWLWIRVRTRMLCCRPGMFIPYPGYEFFFSIPDTGSKRFRIPDPYQRIQVFLTQKFVSKLSEIWSGMFILDPDLVFFTSRIPDPGIEKAPDPGSRGQKGTGSRIRNNLCIHINLSFRIRLQVPLKLNFNFRQRSLIIFRQKAAHSEPRIPAFF
jgi:hypothetical protein